MLSKKMGCFRVLGLKGREVGEGGITLNPRKKKNADCGVQKGAFGTPVVRCRGARIKFQETFRNNCRSSARTVPPPERRP